MQYRVTADNLAPNGTHIWIAIKARQRCGNSASVKPHIAGKVQQPVGGRRPERNVVGRHKPDIVPELQQSRADDVAFDLPHIGHGAWINQYQFDSARVILPQRGDRLQRQGKVIPQNHDHAADRRPGDSEIDRPASVQRQ